MASPHTTSGGGAGAADKTVLNFRRINERLREYEEHEWRGAKGEISGEGLYTAHELAEMMGLSKTHATEKIRRYIRAGILVAGKRKMIIRVDGNPYPVPAYEFVPEKKEQAKR